MVQSARFHKARHSICKYKQTHKNSFTVDNLSIIPQNLYNNLNGTFHGPIDDSTLYMGNVYIYIYIYTIEIHATAFLI